MQKMIASGLILARAIFAQAPEAKLDFEVATVRPAAPRSADEKVIIVRTGGPGSTDPERVRYRSIDLRNLLLEAYGMPVDQLIIPDWVRIERYDIVAKIPPGTTKEQYAVMLRNLLADRFHITSHSEKRDFAVYDLLVAKGGLKMKLSTFEPAPPAPPRVAAADPAAAAAQLTQMLDQARANGPAVDKDGFPALPENGFSAQRTVGNNGQTRTNARGQSMTEIVGILQRVLGGMGRVTDKTGLAGRYDFKLQYGRQLTAVSPVQPGAPGNSDADDPLPDIFAAVQSQLGLKLDKGTAPFDVLVIDHIEKTPTEN